MSRVIVTPPRIIVEERQEPDGEPHLTGTAQQALALEVERAVALAGEVGKNALLRVRRLSLGEDMGNDLLATVRRYQGLLRDLLTEERAPTKLRLLLDKDGGHRVLTDEEFEAEMKQLGIEAVRSLSPEELVQELKARGLSPVVDDDREES